MNYRFNSYNYSINFESTSKKGTRQNYQDLLRAIKKRYNDYLSWPMYKYICAGKKAFIYIERDIL